MTAVGNPVDAVDTESHLTSATVCTVTGTRPAASMGITDIHDHVLIGKSWATHRNPELLLDQEDEAIDEVQAFKHAGGGTVVDAMPSGCGRDAAGLERVSRATGVNIIATAGFHTADYYPTWHWYHRYTEDLLTELLVAEVEQGFDRYDYQGPVIDRIPIRPGVLKAAVGYHRVLPSELRALRVMAAVQRHSGLPLMVHVEHGADPQRALDILESFKVALDRVVLAHMDRNPDWYLHRELLQRGAWLSYDGLYREHYRPVSAVVDMLVRSQAGDWLGQILLGGDVARRPLRRAGGGQGIAGLVLGFRSRMAAELGGSATNQLFEDNPARFLGVQEGRLAKATPDSAVERSA